VVSFPFDRIALIILERFSFETKSVISFYVKVKALNLLDLYNAYDKRFESLLRCFHSKQWDQPFLFSFL
jgi:hypothetical protein